MQTDIRELLVFKSDMLEYREWRDDQDLSMYKANMIITFVKVLCTRLHRSLRSVPNKGSSEDHSTTRFTQAFDSFDAKNWTRDTHLPIKYLHELKNLPKLTGNKLIDARNTAAHQTNRNFARFLEDPIFKRKDRSGQSEFWEPIFQLGKLLSDAYPELYRQLVLKSKFLFVQEDLRPERFATELACRFSGAVKAFLEDNMWKWTPEAVNIWIKDPEQVFTTALWLKAQTSLEAKQFTFRWPRAGERFDDDLMEMDKENPMILPSGLVHFTLFPAMLRVKEERGTVYRRTEESVLRAVVLRQGI
ncbi:MAG: hypothetical protein Q9222_003588 [Ikaeria aurantiellina]